jgi:hypothetical protein
MTVDRPQIRDRSGRAIEYLKFFGGFILGLSTLVTVVIGVREFASQRQQDEITDMLGFIATVDQGAGAISFRSDVQSLVLQFYDKNFYSGDVDTALQDNPVSPVIGKLIQTQIFSKDLIKFKGILAFVDQVHAYAATSACAWKFIAPAFLGDSNVILYYFSPVLYDAAFAKQQNISTVNLENFRDGTLTDQKKAPIPLTPPCNF